MAGEFISINALVAEAASTIKNFSEQEKQLARQWAYTGLRKIGFNKLDVKTSDKLYLTDWSVEKPTDMGNLIDLALFDSAGKEIVIKYKGRAQNSVDGTTARIHEDVRQYKGALHVSEDDTYFNVEEFADDTPTGVYLVARYYAYPVDDNGFPKIPETHTLALIMYIRWMYAMRDGKNLGAEQMARENWLREAAAARGRMNTPTQLEAKETARTINSMIQKVVVRDRQY